MTNKKQRNLKLNKSTKRFLIRFLPLLILLTLCVISMATGISDPTSPPPGLL
ncbi:MAG: hypothetical protein ACFE8U_13285 [Candidatus Hermodarchaeota archaeon]